ncbi:MAG: metal ABC transporter permease [Cytophagales bacterium]|nr:MAG: metal ABC transporter permease [Cytophagales bacterium]TAF62108.1 MAG: metal ABC transporter permease [Cytophagales bacterium]
MNGFWVVIIGALVAASCSILGSFLVLRRMAMLGDAISHAVLPGIVMAYFYTGDRNPLAMLVGAVLIGLLTTFLIQTLQSSLKVQADAAIGLIFTAFFSVGVLLISRFGHNLDLDMDCVLFGEIAYTPFNRWTLENGLYLGPKAVWTMGSALLLIVLFVWFGYRALLVSSFDEKFAAVAGLSVYFWHYALMAMVSVSTVAAFESVGAILVLVFLISPAASAYLFTKNLLQMIFLGCFFGVLASPLGYWLALVIDASVSGCMALVSGTIFMLCLLFKSYKTKFLKSKLSAKGTRVEVTKV